MKVVGKPKTGRTFELTTEFPEELLKAIKYMKELKEKGHNYEVQQELHVWDLGKAKPVKECQNPL